MSSSISPTELRPWKDNIVIFEIVGDDDFVYSYYGKALERAWGHSRLGHTLDALPDDQRRLVRGEYDTALRERLPIARLHTGDFDGVTRAFERLVLPLSNDGVTVDKLMVCAYEVTGAEASEAGASEAGASGIGAAPPPDAPDAVPPEPAPETVAETTPETAPEAPLSTNTASESTAPESTDDAAVGQGPADETAPDGAPAGEPPVQDPPTEDRLPDGPIPDGPPTEKPAPSPLAAHAETADIADTNTTIILLPGATA
ncbi:hypothetical protein M2352_000321 [Azospirillum fermentarium]|uniref:PAS domain-containing protein n=1 Tax=Azospirillum fermentarium TaxID=1233114 RepID=UPI00222735D7|nr:PAS domain-containing protein [Azospirillum fermentarium]MCW2244730.1 hypothetical protein [Azospirillum fermentarium]